jgi:hypothetical protein
MKTLVTIRTTKKKSDRHQLSHLIIHGSTLNSEYPDILAACSFGVKYDESGCSPLHVVIHLIATSSALMSTKGKFNIPKHQADDRPATKRGLATLLLSYLDIIFRRTYPDVTVVAAVSPENENAKGFFQANGFVEGTTNTNVYANMELLMANLSKKPTWFPMFCKFLSFFPTRHATAPPSAPIHLRWERTRPTVTHTCSSILKPTCAKAAVSMAKPTHCILKWLY